MRVRRAGIVPSVWNLESDNETSIEAARYEATRREKKVIGAGWDRRGRPVVHEVRGVRGEI
jgi:hypothetical protein